MNKSFEPDGKFVERLGWQLSSEFRRADRLKPASGRIAVPRGIAAAALMIGIMTTGVTVIKAAEYIKDSWRKKIEVARAEKDFQVNEARLEFFRRSASRTAELAAKGLVGEDERLAGTAAADKAKLEMSRSIANLDEVKISGEAPRDELYAPKVGGRDFVAERLEIRRMEAELELQQLEGRTERCERLAKEAMISQGELKAAREQTAFFRDEISAIQKRLELRKSFLDGTLTAQEVEIQDRLSVAAGNLAAAKAKIESLRAELKRNKDLESRGLISGREASQLQFLLDAAEAEWELAVLENDVLIRLR